MKVSAFSDKTDYHQQITVDNKRYIDVVLYPDGQTSHGWLLRMLEAQKMNIRIWLVPNFGTSEFSEFETTTGLD